MLEKKNNEFARVNIRYDGKVHKCFLGPRARLRYENEVRVLEYLSIKNCSFVPKLIVKDDKNLKVITSNCGHKVENISSEKFHLLFAELETFGVRHNDQSIRNITYSPKLGRFCLIDFEFASILEKGYEKGLEPYFDPDLSNGDFN